jgi:hypothetical protein
MLPFLRTSPVSMGSAIHSLFSGPAPPQMPDVPTEAFSHRGTTSPPYCDNPAFLEAIVELFPMKIPNAKLKSGKFR